VTLALEKPAGTQVLDYIRVYDIDLSGPFKAVAAVTDGWRTHSWYHAGTQRYHSEATKELAVRNLDDQPEIQRDLINATVEAVKAYCDALMPWATVHHLSPPRLNRYEVGTLMRMHSDHIHSIFDGQAKGVPVLSIVGNLNDGYEGGVLTICGQPYDLKANQIIVFPSCFMFPHEVTELTAGTRYSFVSWAW
jgi:predicted 2-oxoglutarate/Fe(II)-dependent dioxygenase YbiX